MPENHHKPTSDTDRIYKYESEAHRQSKLNGFFLKLFGLGLSGLLGVLITVILFFGSELIHDTKSNSAAVSQLSSTVATVSVRTASLESTIHDFVTKAEFNAALSIRDQLISDQAKEILDLKREVNRLNNRSRSNQ